MLMTKQDYLGSYQRYDNKKTEKELEHVQIYYISMTGAAISSTNGKVMTVVVGMKAGKT